MNKALFLDRDGVINVDKEYIYKPDDLVFTDGIAKLIQTAKQKYYKVICITNQSGIARGFFKENDLKNFMAYLNHELINLIGFPLDAYYYCPHHPFGVVEAYSYVCDCRKPAAGLIEVACKDFNIDCSSSIFIGDKFTDLQAAEKMNISKLYLYSKTKILFENPSYLCINDFNQVII
ncbi:D-glycero-alpha-D-manno-heptose-1,7-bisphosphate 7-phosphatase [Prochlorococcus marinus]|uniref:D-glycero-alpha-D-manno-heptose-1,7-bisphosphate 7-phosphatase n=1 Tax=Prochlorococcus marinus TaxID=1219 RepID=UPI0022B47A7D|nr:HAD family hydrolase [Prochlorococcus marinus]